jgi:iron(III) transport system ATP-binding protein
VSIAPTPQSTTIQIASLVKTYPAIAPAPGSPPTTTAVDSVSLRIEAGELFFLLGPSGCGKTTLLRMIAGFIEPTAGSIRFEDAKGNTDVTFLPAEKRDTGMVFQSYALWPHMTVAQNVGFGLEVRKVPAAEREKLVLEALAQVRMEQYAQRKPNQLSGGQQQRVALARAIVIRPRVLLLDEPLSNLDAKLRIELRGEIRRICKEARITGVYVTHDQKEALSMADRIAVMRAGKIVQLGTPSELYRRPGGRFVAEFLGETNLLEGTVLSRGGGVVRVRTSVGDLESLVETENCPGVGDAALVSIRHEALQVGEAGGPNRFEAEIQESVYLGEIAQQSLKVGGVNLVRTLLNPREESPTGRVACWVDARDVVVMPAGQ